MACSDLLFKLQVFTFSSKLYSLSRFLSVESIERSIFLQIRVHTQQQIRFTDTFWSIQHAENSDLLQRPDSYMLLSAGAIRSRGCMAFLKEMPINCISSHYHKYGSSHTFPNYEVMPGHPLELLGYILLDF